MAKWVSANMSGFLPPGTNEIISAIEALLPLVKVPLETVATVLNASKALLVSANSFDYLGTLVSLIDNYKNSFLTSGIYVCHMWDYPIRQLKQSSVAGIPSSNSRFGPNQTIDNINLRGNVFEESFLADFDGSFDDYRDPDAPRFNNDVAMLLLVTSAPSIDLLGANTQEDSLADAFAGFQETVGAAAKQIRRIRATAMLAKLKLTAQNQPANKVSVRVDRIELAIHSLGSLSDDDLASIAFPQDQTGSFFEDKSFDTIDWKSEVLPVIQSIESKYFPRTYPDWGRITLGNINPSLTQLVDSVFDPVLDLFKSGNNMQDSIVLLIDSINQKIKALEDIIEQTSVIQEEIDRLLRVTGYHAIYITTSKGTNDLRKQLREATNVPFSGNNFYSGMALVAGSDTKVVFDALFSVVGE